MQPGSAQGSAYAPKMIKAGTSIPGVFGTLSNRRYHLIQFTAGTIICDVVCFHSALPEVLPYAQLENFNYTLA